MATRRDTCQADRSPGNGWRFSMELDVVRQALDDGQDLSQLRDRWGNSLLDGMICRPCRASLTEDWPSYLGTVRTLSAQGAKCRIRMDMLLEDELSDRLSIDKLQIALHAGLRDKLKVEAFLHFHVEQGTPCPASLDTCLLRRLIRELPRVHLLSVKLQCLEVTKLLLKTNARSAISTVRREIRCIYLRMKNLPGLLADYAATAPFQQSMWDALALLAPSIWASQMDLAAASAAMRNPTVKQYVSSYRSTF